MFDHWFNRESQQRFLRSEASAIASKFFNQGKALPRSRYDPTFVKKASKYCIKSLKREKKVWKSSNDVSVMQNIFLKIPLGVLRNIIAYSMYLA